VNTSTVKDLLSIVEIISRIKKYFNISPHSDATPLVLCNGPLNEMLCNRHISLLLSGTLDNCDHLLNIR